MNAALDAAIPRSYTKGVKRVPLYLLFVVVWSGCSRQAPPPFELTIELKQDRIKQYSQPFIRFKLKNVSDKPQWVFEETFPDPSNLFGGEWEERGLYLEAIDPNGERLYSGFESDASEECRYRVLKPGERIPEPTLEERLGFAQELAPGETLTSSYFLFNKGCSTTVAPDPSWQGFAEIFHLLFAEPGRYSIRAVYDTRPHEGVQSTGISPDWEGRVVSNELFLTVER